jgi:ketosteroid isomerase-like protein
MNRSTRLAASSLPLIALSLVGCSASKDVQLPHNVTTALETAFNRGDIQACANLYTDDAEIIAEDAPTVSGKSAIERFFGEQVAREISFDTDTRVSVVSGDVAFEHGTYRIRNVVQGVEVEQGDYLNVWRRTNGQWKAYRSMYNVTMSPNVAVSVADDNDNDNDDPSGRAM